MPCLSLCGQTGRCCASLRLLPAAKIARRREVAGAVVCADQWLNNCRGTAEILAEARGAAGE